MYTMSVVKDRTIGETLPDTAGLASQIPQEWQDLAPTRRPVADETEKLSSSTAPGCYNCRCISSWDDYACPVAIDPRWSHVLWVGVVMGTRIMNQNRTRERAE